MADVLEGVDYGKYLAEKLTDLEFETLIRERVKMALRSHWYYNQLNGNSTNAQIRIHADSTDAIEWEVIAYINYNKYQVAKGEVLSRTAADAYNMIAARETNKLSNLLPPPPPAPTVLETVEEPNGQDPVDDNSGDTGGSSST